MKEEIQYSKGTRDLIRANLVRGLYYHDDESLIKTAETISMNIPDKIEFVKKVREIFSKLKYLKDKWSKSSKGIIYLEYREKQILLKKIYEFEQEYNKHKQMMIELIITGVEKAKITQTGFNIMSLKKLPIKFTEEGTGIEGTGEDEEEYD